MKGLRRWVNGGALLLLTAIAAAQTPIGAGVNDTEQLVPRDKRSGSAFQSAQTRAMQADPMGNPGLLWVSEGQSLWNVRTTAARSCAECHGRAEQSMRGVAARYPAIDTISGKLLNIEARINTCRTRQQKTTAFAHESDELLALSAFIGYQSRGMPMSVSIDGACSVLVRARARLLCATSRSAQSCL